jgi:hypothetical protein
MDKPSKRQDKGNRWLLAQTGPLTPALFPDGGEGDRRAPARGISSPPLGERTKVRGLPDEGRRDREIDSTQTL